MTALATALVGLVLSAPAPAPTSSAPKASAPKYASKLHFHGWSKNSRWVAYTRTRRRPPPKRGAKPQVERQYMHRRVQGGQFAGFGKMVGGDVRTYAKDKGYIVEELQGRSVSPHRIQFDGLDLPVTLDVVVDDKVWWELRRGDRLIASKSFDQVYVGAAAVMYPSPDRRQALLVMHLDTGWVIDAAIYPVSLPVAPAALEPNVNTISGRPLQQD